MVGTACHTSSYLAWHTDKLVGRLVHGHHHQPCALPCAAPAPMHQHHPLAALAAIRRRASNCRCASGGGDVVLGYIRTMSAAAAATVADLTAFLAPHMRAALIVRWSQASINLINHSPLLKLACGCGSWPLRLCCQVLEGLGISLDKAPSRPHVGRCNAAGSAHWQ